MPKFRYVVRYVETETYEVEAVDFDHVESEVANGNEGKIIESDSFPGDIVEVWAVEDE